MLAGRQGLSVGCPESSSQTVLADLVSTFRIAVVDINHLVQHSSTCPNSPQLPCIQIPERRSPLERKLLVLCIPLVLVLFNHGLCIAAALCRAIILYHPSDGHDVRRPFLAYCLQDSMILISPRRFNLPIKRNHFISDLL